jgi:hypothetical protein
MISKVKRTNLLSCLWIQPGCWAPPSDHDPQLRRNALQRYITCAIIDMHTWDGTYPGQDQEILCSHKLSIAHWIRRAHMHADACRGNTAAKTAVHRRHTHAEPGAPEYRRSVQSITVADQLQQPLQGITEIDASDGCATCKPRGIGASRPNHLALASPPAYGTTATTAGAAAWVSHHTLRHPCQNTSCVQPHSGANACMQHTAASTCKRP